MYSILCLGVVMLMDGFGVKFPQWVSPAVTFLVIGFFLYKSKKHIKLNDVEDAFKAS
jgi:uncharacterized protein